MVENSSGKEKKSKLTSLKIHQAKKKVLQVEVFQFLPEGLLELSKKAANLYSLSYKMGT
ncbi:hypothetical protein [Porphyromonas macacae]|uniref:hypothetical protein n=1 Tax=Porphyromonas macacae TaxID=28115 RepID=UPI000373B3BB|nr:hypothetical protein [Porphyromonas macacae]